MNNQQFNLVDEVYFFETSGLHTGYIEKFNEHTINVLVDDDSQPEGYRTWRVEEFFLAKTPEDAKAKWDNYKNRLDDFKKLVNVKRKSHSFFRGVSVLVEPFNKVPYKGMVLSIGKAALVIATEDGRFMKVDKALSTPIPEVINFNNFNMGVLF